MINIFLGTDTVFTTQGEGVLRPISCKETKTIGEEWFVEVEADLSYLSKLVHDAILYVPTKYGKQPFRINNPEVGRTIKFKAHHVGYDTKNYVVDDTSSVNKNCQDAMSWAQGLTTPDNTFTVYSDILTVKTVGYTQQTLYEAMQEIATEYSGFLDFDGWQIRITSTLGSDRGVELRYGKNLESATYASDWSEVCTQLKPLGNGTLAGDWMTSTYSYAKPYARVVKFDADDASTLTALATAYMAENEIPKVNYKVNASTSSSLQTMKIQTVDDENVTTKVIGDTLVAIISKGNALINDTIKVYARQFTVLANVLSYCVNTLTQQYVSIEFGNYRPTARNVFTVLQAKTQERTLKAAQIKFDDINGEIGLMVSKDDVVNQINLSTEGILIDADKITLEGVITANNYFKINLDGSMETIAGKIGRFSIDDNDIYYESELFAKQYDNSDVTRLRQILAGILTGTTYDSYVYDINSSGTLTTTDLVQLNEVVAGTRSNPNKMIRSIITIGTTTGQITVSSISTDGYVGPSFAMQADKMVGKLANIESASITNLTLNGLEVYSDAGTLKVR